MSGAAKNTSEQTAKNSSGASAAYGSISGSLSAGSPAASQASTRSSSYSIFGRNSSGYTMTLVQPAYASGGSLSTSAQAWIAMTTRISGVTSKSRAPTIPLSSRNSTTRSRSSASSSSS